MNDIRFGQSIPRREDARFVTGGGQYTDDVAHSDALRAVFVRSPYPSARVRSIDASAALALPGVLAVLTGADLDADGFNDCPKPVQLTQGDGTLAQETPRPYLVRDRVRFAGEPVAMVLAQTEQAAQDAAEQVMVDYEELPVVADINTASAAGAATLWDDRPSNVAFHWRRGDPAAVEAALTACAHVTRLTFQVSRVSAMPLEPRAALAYRGSDGRPVMQVAHQSPHALRDQLALLFGLPKDGLRVLAGDVGGSFGMKWGPQREEVLVFWAARRLGHAVRWTATRSEAFLCDEQARDVKITGELGLDADGYFTALRVRYDLNIGAYFTPRSVSQINNMGGIVGVYRTPLVAGEVIGVLTNLPSTGAYRGAGRPEATYTIERLIDLAASETGRDPAQLRRMNLIAPQDLPYQTPFGFTYDCGDFEQNLDKALELSGYTGFAQRRAQAQARGRLRGIGLAMPIEPAAGMGSDRARVEVHPDGRVTVHAGAMSVGQGHATALSSLAADRLGVPAQQVTHSQGDTDLIEDGKGNGGSSALSMCGSAVAQAIDDLLASARAAAARRLNVPQSDLKYHAGEFLVAASGLRCSLAELAGQAPLHGSGHFVPSQPNFPNGCHVCEVEIVPDTGALTVVGYVSVEDVGRVLNPMLVEGQIHGGVAQGLGQALCERIHYDASGQLLTGSFMDYPMPRATDIPLIVSHNLETPTALNPLGVKGVGEAGTVGALAAAMNAVCHALQPAGIAHIDMPATPLRIWEALRDAGHPAAARP